MKTKIHAFFLFALAVLFAASAGWAEEVSLLSDGQGGFFVNMPVTGKNTLTIPENRTTFKVYDDGQDATNPGYYSNNANGYLQLVAPEGYLLQVSGSINTESGYDKLSIFNGDEGSAKLVNAISGAYDEIGPVSGGRIVTIYFYSDYGGTRVGLDLTVTLVLAEAHEVSIETAENGSVVSEPTSAKIGDVVTLTATPNQGFVLDNVVYVDGEGGVYPVEGHWYSPMEDGSYTLSFVMPNSEVSVIPAFTNDFSSFSFNLPYNGDTIRASIPAVVSTFPVYDNGGPSRDYAAYGSGYLALTAPEGYVLQLTGTVATNHAILTVYDGTFASTTRWQRSSSSNGTVTDIGTIVSSDRTMSLKFASSYSQTASGLDLLVSLQDASVGHAVTVANGVAGGTVAGTGNFTVSQEVSLTLTPDEDYVYESVQVVDEYDNILDVVVGTDGSETTVTFTMPYANVTVTPTFITPHAITIESAQFGNMTSDVQMALVGETVHLTAYPEDGAELVSVNVVTAGGQSNPVSWNGNTASFPMPDQPVTVTPSFAKPDVVTFDDNGCLSNGTYFHMGCYNNSCFISQEPVAYPNEGTSDFKCWSDLASYLTSNYSAYEVRLNTSLDFGGYDEANGKCKMANFMPIELSGNNRIFNGLEHTISGFCYEDNEGEGPNSMGFLKGVKTVLYVTFDNAHVVVKNAAQGSIVGIVADEIANDNSSFSDVRVLNSYVAGTQVGAFAGRISGDAYINNSSVIDTKVYGLNEGTQGVMISAAGGFAGYAIGYINLKFLQDTVLVTTAGAGLVADDASYTGTDGNYRGGFIGHQGSTRGDNYLVNVQKSLVNGLSVSGSHGTSYVGALAGDVQWLLASDMKLENITVSGAYAGGLAGSVGDADYGDWYSDGVTLAGTNSVSGSVVAGGLLGYGHFSSGGSEGDKDVKFENLLVNVDVMGGPVVGGLAGRITNESYGSVSATANNIVFNGSVSASVADMTLGEKIGGLFGDVVLGNHSGSGSLNITKVAFNGDVSFENTGTQGTLYMGSLFGYVDGAILTVYGNYSVGNISYSGASPANVGYLGGYFVADGSNAQIYGNYHYGTDAVATGLGNVSAANWKKGTEAYFANVRNEVTGLDNDGKLGFHYYEMSGGPLETSYMDLFAANLNGGNFGRVANGVASESDMKSALFAAAMNQVVSRYASKVVWTQSGNALPTIATPAEKTNWLLPLVVMDVSMFTLEQKAELGVDTIVLYVDESENVPTVTQAIEGFVGYTDVTGHANGKFVDSLQAVMQALEGEGLSPYLSGEGAPDVITANTVFTEGVESIAIMTNRATKSYEVVYQYCDETCTNLDELTGTSLVFMSPKVASVSNNEAAYTTLVPYAVALTNPNTKLAVSASYLDESGDQVPMDPVSIEGFVSFSELVERAGDDASVSKILLSYTSGDVPNAVIKKPDITSYTLSGYVYDALGEKTELFSNMVSQDTIIPYVASIAASGFDVPVGYEYGNTYSISFTVSNPNDGRCSNIASVGVVESESRDIAPWEELYMIQNECTSKAWVVGGLTTEDAVSMENVKIARALRKNEIGNGVWADTFAIIPNFIAKPYNITFNFDGNLEFYGNGYSLYVADDYNDPTNPQGLDDANKAFPMFYGVPNAYGSVVKLAGWTLDASKANCRILDDGCYENEDGLYLELTPDLIADAGDVETIQLYPVWKDGSTFGSSGQIYVGSCLVVGHPIADGEVCYASPITFTLSQSRTIGGSPVTFAMESDNYDYSWSVYDYSRYGVELYRYGNNTYTFDIDVKPSPGFKVDMNSVRANGYDASTGTVTLGAEGNVTFMAEYEVLNYNVKLDLENVASDAFLGRSWTSTQTMSVHSDNFTFPKVYVRESWSTAYGTPYWGVKTADGFEGHSKVFDTKLAGQFLADGYEYYTPAANENEDASVTVYAVEIIESASSTTYQHAQELEVFAVDGDGQRLQGGASDYHGSLVLTQTYDDNENDIHLSLEHASWLDGDRHILYIPNNDDTLTFTVSARPEPGYTMTIEPLFDYAERTVQVVLNHGGAINWGYNASTGKLNIQPVAMNSMAFKVHFEQLTYNVVFDRPTPESKVIVANSFTDGAYRTAWLEAANNVNASISGDNAPRLYNEAGCRIGWKLKDRSVTEQRETSDFASEFEFMTSLEDDPTAVNEVVPDWENPVCDEGDGTITVTLNVEGSGEVYLVQKIGDAPAGADDPEQTVIAHRFVSTGEGQPMELHLPRIIDDYEENVGSKYYLVVEPAEGYVLNSLSYDMMLNGQSVTVLAQDGSELDIFNDMSMRVKFEQYKPVFVTYDLALGGNDSSKVWIPADAVQSGSLQIGADGSDAPMWTPYRSDMCFAGWSKTDPNGPQPEVDMLFTDVATWNVGEFSDDPAAPTHLYAKWASSTNGCGNQSNVTASVGLRYYEDAENAEWMGSTDVLVLTQNFGGAVFTHRSHDFSLPYNPAGYEVSAQIVPGTGYELDESVPEMSVYVQSYFDGGWVSEPVTGQNGVYVIGDNNRENQYGSGPSFFFGRKENKISYSFAYNANAGDTPAFYGENWSGTASKVLEDAFDKNVFRTGVCLVGWSFNPDAANGGAAIYSHEVNTSFINSYDSLVAAGGTPVLYAVWSDNEDNCLEPIPTTVTATLSDDLKDGATVELVQNVDGEETVVAVVGEHGLDIPVQIPRSISWHGGTEYVGEYIYFSKMNVVPRAGYKLDATVVPTYQIGANEAVEIADGMTEFGVLDNMVISGVAEIVPYNIVYHENVGDTTVFYGEHWTSTTTVNVNGKDTLSRSLYRSDKILGGWRIESSDIVFVTVNELFIDEYEKYAVDGNPVNLYAVWTTDLPSPYVTATLSDELKGKATVELIQDVAGVETVVATVGADGLFIPKVQPQAVSVNGGTEYVGEYIYFSKMNVVPAVGYKVSETVVPTYEIGGNGSVEIAEGMAEFNVLDEMVISATVEAVPYNVAFDVNAGNANVFYPTDWESETSYDIVENDGAEFPKAYRTDKCLVGWGFNKDASRSESFAVFDTNFVNAYNAAVSNGAEAPITLYGVWNECSQVLYTVRLYEPVEGSLVLSQNGNTYDVPTNGFTVPAATPALEFGVSYIVNDGYQFDDEGVFNVVNSEGTIVAEVENNVLVVDGDKIVDAPAAAKPYTFAFNVNVDDGVNVFYGDDWKEDGNYELAVEAVPFPMQVYRVGACLDGWTIGRESSTAFSQYDDAFVAAVENASKAGLPTSVLYAKWGDCTSQTVATVTNADAAAGTFTLSRTVSGTEAQYTVAGEALEIPADDALEFTVTYAANKGYTYDELEGISAMDEQEAPVEMDGSVLTVAASLTLSAAVSADEFSFALVENADNANVFYTGTLVTSFSAKITDDEATRTLPANLYRSDACLDGWNFTATATTGFKQLDESFVAAYKSMAETPTTLYAVWNTECRQTLVTVASADSLKGALTLAQADGRSFEVGSGLKMPYVATGFDFTMSFEPAVGFSFDESAGFVAFDAQSVSLGEIEDGAVTVSQSMVIKAKSLSESVFTISFNENPSLGNSVYYGNGWLAASGTRTYSLADSAAFPMDLYSVDACFAGWTLDINPEENDPVFTSFNTAFVEAATEVGSQEITLHGKWTACTANSATVSQVSYEAGYLELVQYDALGNEKNRDRIASDAVSFPLGKGDVSFAIEFEPNPGYVLVDGGYFYTVDANGNNLMALVDGKLSLAGNTIVKAPVRKSTYEIAFDVNIGSPVMFFGNSWRSSGEYDVTLDETLRQFPTQVYRLGYKLVGWSIDKRDVNEVEIQELPDGGAGYVGVYTSFDDALVELLSDTQTSTLHGVWVSDPNQQTYTVSLFNPNAGSVRISQSADGYQTGFDVDEDGFVVPAVSGGILFDVNMTFNNGYFAEGFDLLVVDSEGNVTAQLNDNKLNVASDRLLKIPVEADGVQLVFAENTGARVFYENGWNNKGFFALDGETEFPNGILRTDARLLGWALSKGSSKYYEFYDAEFVEDLRNYNRLGLPTDTLFAVWDEFATVETMLVTNDNDRNGSFAISQTVDGVETAPLTVDAAGVSIPRSEKGLTFNVSFNTKPGYYINSEEAILASDVQGETLGSTTNGGSLVFGQEAGLKLAASVAAVPYKFSYDVNGGDANVFYGDDWSSSDEKTLDDESVALPDNIYRADARLVGWSFDPDATEGSFDLTSDLVRDVSVSNEVRTLYAVWEKAEVETYTVSFANTNVGSLVLTQDVEDTTVSFNVSDSGLVVPVVRGGLKFKAAYTLKAGYSGSTDSLYVIDDISGLLTSLADGNLTVAEDVTLTIPTDGVAFDVAFHENRKNGTLFYGNDWVGRNVFMLNDSVAAIPLPAYLYTADACVVGWSLDSKGEGTVYTEFTSELADDLLSGDKKEVYDLYAVWGSASDCESAYDRIALDSKNGTVKLVETPRDNETEAPVHEFAKDGTLLLPKVMNGNMLRVVSVPDSSFVLDSLVVSRDGSDERQLLRDGDALPFSMYGATLTAFFGKSNRTEIEFVNPELAKTGNAVQFSFTTSAFEVTRGVSAYIILETEDGEFVTDTLLAESIVPPYSGYWTRFPLAADKYVLTAKLYDAKDTVEVTERFEVKAEIAAVAEDSWQMISLVNLDKDAMDWNDDDARFYWWDESSAMGDFWQYRAFDPDDEIDPTRGYWYSSLEGRPLVLKPTVDELVTDKVVWKLDSINSGWNLVANPYGFAVNVYGDNPHANVAATEESEVNFWHWNPETSEYEEAVVVGPYEAVWAEVRHSTDWILRVNPEFVSEKDSSGKPVEPALSKRILAKATNNKNWTLQAVLTDAKGKKDSWNIFGASTRPFVTDEPPAGMGDRVNLSIVEGKRALAKSVKAPADELEWNVELSASSDRVGELSFKGVASLNEVGLKVFVTVDGKTTEMREDEPLRVSLTSLAKKATVRVAPGAKVVASFSIDALRYVKSGTSVGVTFEASEGLAGSRTVVDILGMDGHVVSSRSATTLAGVNQLVLDAPKPGLYMLRVRAGSQMKAGRIMVK